MNRRTFFRNILVGGAAVLAAPAILANLPEASKTVARTVGPMRADVSMLLAKLKQDMERGCGYFLFEPNNKLTRDRLTLTLGSCLDHYKATRAINEYKVVCDESNNPPSATDRNQLNVDLFVQPARTPEYIVLNIGIA